MDGWLVFVGISGICSCVAGTGLEVKVNEAVGVGSSPASPCELTSKIIPKQ